jgi:hypothetical protein
MAAISSKPANATYKNARPKPIAPFAQVAQLVPKRKKIKNKTGKKVQKGGGCSPHPHPPHRHPPIPHHLSPSVLIGRNSRAQPWLDLGAAGGGEVMRVCMYVCLCGEVFVWFGGVCRFVGLSVWLVWLVGWAWVWWTKEGGMYVRPSLVGQTFFPGRALCMPLCHIRPSGFVLEERFYPFFWGVFFAYLCTQNAIYIFLQVIYSIYC